MWYGPVINFEASHHKNNKCTWQAYLRQICYFGSLAYFARDLTAVIIKYRSFHNFIIRSGLIKIVSNSGSFYQLGSRLHSSSGLLFLACLPFLCTLKFLFCMKFSLPFNKMMTKLFCLLFMFINILSWWALFLLVFTWHLFFQVFFRNSCQQFFLSEESLHIP